MFSDWVNSCKSSLLQSSEWKKVSNELHSVLSDKLSRDCVGFFADLSFSEQLAYVKQIKRYDLQNTKIYDDFLSKLTELVEQYISMQVDKLEQSKNPNLLNLSRLDKILHITSEGTAALLHNFPHKEIESQLCGLSNISLSPSLRKEIWKIVLFNNQKYENNDHQPSDEEEPSRSLILNGFKITEKCESILLTASQRIEVPNINPAAVSAGFGDLNTLLPLMKAVMIRYHEEIGFFNADNAATAELSADRYFYFIIPVLVTISDFLIESIINKISSYRALEIKAAKWFKQLISSNAVNNEQPLQYDINLDSIRFGDDKYLKYYQQFEALVINKSPSLYSALRSVAVRAQLIMDNEEENKGSVNWIRAITEPLIADMIEYWFVTTVNIETTLHIWDQLMLRRFDTLPLIICALLSVISDQIKECQNVDGFTSICKRYLPTIHYTMLMKEMHKIKYYKSSNKNNKMTMMMRKNEMEENDEKIEFMQSKFVSDDVTIEMLQPLKAPPVTVQINKLFAAMVFVGKLQRIRYQNMVKKEMRERQQREEREIRKKQEREQRERQEREQREMEEAKDEIKEEVIEKKEDTVEKKEETKTVTALVLEECIVQILTGFRDVSMLASNK